MKEPEKKTADDKEEDHKKKDLNNEYGAKSHNIYVLLMLFGVPAARLSPVVVLWLP